MNSTFLNEVIVAPHENIDVKLLQYLMSIRESANLMIMATSVKEMDWKKSHGALAESFNTKIQQLSKSDQNQLSNFTSIIRYRDHSNQCMRGLSITFGRTPKAHIYESTFRNDVETFIRNLPKAQQGLINHITLPIIRIALLVHSMRSSLDGREALRPWVLEDFALLDFNSHDWRYTVDRAFVQYEVKVNSNDPVRNSFYLRVSEPSKQISKKYLEPCWIFDNKATGFSFYNIADLTHLKPLSNKKPVYIHTQKLSNEDKGDDIEQVNTMNIKKLSQAISNHEAYWSGILYDLLKQADIEFERRVFRSDASIFIDPNFKGRSFELTKDFMGTHSEGVIAENGFSLKYFIDPEIYSEEGEEGETSQIDRFHQSMLDLSQLQNSIPHAVPLEFNQVFSAQDADLIVGRYDRDHPWMSAPDFHSMDAYGKQKMSDLINGEINTKQFITLNEKYAIENLKRAVSECYLKRWFSKSNAKKEITIENAPELTGRRFLVLSSMRKRQVNVKPKKDNIFYCCYLVEGDGDQLIFSRPNLFAEMGKTPYEKESDKLKFVDFYYPFTDQKLQQLEEIIDLIENDENEDSIVESIGTRYLNNDVTLIFEYNADSIISIWESQQDDLWFPPALDGLYSPKRSFFEFLQCGIDAQAFTKSLGKGKITQDKRMSKDPHYEIMIDGNKVLIHRKRFNQDQKIGRHILRQWTRLYPSQPTLSLDDCNLLVSGLLSPEAGAYKDSGVAQTVYEKISKLFI